MKSSSKKGLSKPFKGLDERLKQKSISLPDQQTEAARLPEDAPPSSPEDDARLFQEAMTGVRRLEQNKHVPVPLCSVGGFKATSDEDAEALERLEALIEKGEGFRVSDTSEYIEGTGYPISPEIVRQLHQGYFSVQTHLDLHGLSVAQARRAFDRFLSEAVSRSLGAVLIIHGRGLSSPVEPVLKSKVEKWLNRAPWRKWLVAYASARLCDGGGGATAVLLRQRPLDKRLRKSGQLNKE